jgi:hypothetical protein
MPGAHGSKTVGGDISHRPSDCEPILKGVKKRFKNLEGLSSKANVPRSHLRPMFVLKHIENVSPPKTAATNVTAVRSQSDPPAQLLHRRSRF